jgi:hypothetical protein
VAPLRASTPVTTNVPLKLPLNYTT